MRLVSFLFVKALVAEEIGGCYRFCKKYTVNYDLGESCFKKAFAAENMLTFYIFFKKCQKIVLSFLQKQNVLATENMWTYVYIYIYIYLFICLYVSKVFNTALRTNLECKSTCTAKHCSWAPTAISARRSTSPG